jgi:hypothetical protein
MSGIILILIKSGLGDIFKNSSGHPETRPPEMSRLRLISTTLVEIDSGKHGNKKTAPPLVAENIISTKPLCSLISNFLLC